MPTLRDADGKPNRVRCDGFGCGEAHPIHHDMIGEPGFTYGRWLGWVYLDINDARLAMEPLRFCGFPCLKDHLDRIADAQRDRYKAVRGEDSAALAALGYRPDDLNARRPLNRA